MPWNDLSCSIGKGLAVVLRPTLDHTAWIQGPLLPFHTCVLDKLSEEGLLPSSGPPSLQRLSHTLLRTAPPYSDGNIATGNILVVRTGRDCVRGVLGDKVPGPEMGKIV